MKKTLLSMCAMAAMLFATSCSQEEDFAFVTDGSDANVSLSVQLPQEIATRADYSDGHTAQTLMVAFYDAADKNDMKTPLLQDTLSFNGGLTTTVNVNLATGKTYNIIFWAQSTNNETYKIDWKAQTMTVDYTKMNANDENNDAFYHFEKELKVSNAIEKKITLYRPFAQINLGTSDYEAAAKAGLTVDRSAMKAVQLPSVLNLAKGTVSGDVEVEVKANTIPGATEEVKAEKFPVNGYEYLEMNYVLVGTDKELINCEFYIYETGATSCLDPHIVVSNVPVQRNYRTNIYGALLTDPANFNVEIKPAYEEGDYNVYHTLEEKFRRDLVNPDLAVVTLEGDLNFGTETIVVRRDVTIDMAGYEFVAGGVGSVKTYAFEVYDSKVTFENANIPSGGIAVSNGEVTFRNGTSKLNNAGPRYLFYAQKGSKIFVEDGEFAIVLRKDKNKYIYADATSEVYVNGGAWGTNNGDLKPNTPFAGTGKIEISAGTFNVNPTNYLANGCVAEKNGELWVIKSDDDRFVDLGLSVLWAKCNIKANTETEVGQYFSWGDLTPVDNSYSWVEYDFYTGEQYTNVTIDYINKYNAKDGLTTLEAVDDAATAFCDKNCCRMPTVKEMQELKDNCDWAWDAEKKGFTVTGKNGNSIFLPAGGYLRGSNFTDNTTGVYCVYWTSSVNESNMLNAWSLEAKDGSIGIADNAPRNFGLLIRPVK